MYRENEAIDRVKHYEYRQCENVCPWWSRQAFGGKLSGANQVNSINKFKIIEFQNTFYVKICFKHKHAYFKIFFKYKNLEIVILETYIKVDQYLKFEYCIWLF